MILFALSFQRLSDGYFEARICTAPGGEFVAGGIKILENGLIFRA